MKWYVFSGDFKVTIARSDLNSPEQAITEALLEHYNTEGIKIAPDIRANQTGFTPKQDDYVIPFYVALHAAGFVEEEDDEWELDI